MDLPDHTPTLTAHLFLELLQRIAGWKEGRREHALLEPLRRMVG